MNRIQLGLVAACCGAGLWAAGKPASRADRPWNVVLIVADDLGWADLACYGADLHETPQLDRLARESVKFTQAYAAAAICSPTRASLMTGKSPARLHLTIWHEYALRPPDPSRRLLPPRSVANLPLAELTIAEALRAAGYQTFHVGKWHLGEAGYYPETQGFDVNIGGTCWGAPETYFYPYVGDQRFSEYRYVPHLEFGHPGEYLTDRLTDEALRVLERADRERPFFLNLCYHSVHTPIEAPAEWVAYFARRRNPRFKHQNPVYAAMVYLLDRNVGRVLRRLEELGVADRTLVIFTSDNGGVAHRKGPDQVTDNYPLRSGKGSLYEGGIRVPLLVRWPGVTPPGAVCDVPVVTTDFYPTLIEALGLTGRVPVNAPLDGVSFVPLLRRPQGTLARRRLYFHYPHYYPTTTPVSAIREGDWKLLHYYEDDRLELYHLSEDLGEQHNLAAAQPERAHALKRALDDWLSAVNAQFPTPNPRWRR